MHQESEPPGERLDPLAEEIPMLRNPGRALVAMLVAFAPMPAVRGADNLRTLEPAEVMSGVRDYGFLWWADGWRGRSENGGKVLCVRTGNYGLALDVERLRLLHLGAISEASPADRAVAEDNATIMNLPAADLDIAVELGGVRYRPVGVESPNRDALVYPVRLIESGRWLQRFDVERLIFENDKKERLDADARLEVVAWPDLVSFSVELKPRGDLGNREIRISCRLAEEGSGASTTSSVGHARTGQTITEILVKSFGTPAGTARVEATRPDGAAIPVELARAAGWYRLVLPTESWDPVTDPDHLERVRLKVQNPDDQESVVRLLFAKDDGFAGITGMTPMIRDVDGFPTGLAVQVSKNWHQRAGRSFLYQGPWFHGFTLLRLPPKSQVELEFAMTYARWGGVPAASHAQLCLIGWGTNQRWDQAAIGSWGESICYDPDICLNRSMIDDIRPLMVWGMNQSKAKWTWTNNVGGGDFLVYVDPNGTRQYLTRMRAWYASHGPNLTDVTYAGVSADGAIAARLNVLTPRSDDVNRAIHRIRYDVLKPTPFRRLAFYQVGADNYNDHQFTTLARGDATGLAEEWEPPRGGRRYSRTGIACSGETPWFSLHGAVNRDDKGGAWANRGLVIRKWSARLGRQPVNAPTSAVFGTENRFPSANLELTPPPGLTELQPGDFVEAVLELVIMPVSAEDYYGPNSALSGALRSGENTWKMLLREATGNSLTVDSASGRVVNSWPLVIAVDARGSAEVVLNGGLGYVPVTFGRLSSYRDYELWFVVGQGPRRVDQAIHGRDFWQTDFDPTSRTWSLTYNVPVDTKDDRPGRVRLVFRKTE
jgi:hypothetical protein